MSCVECRRDTVIPFTDFRDKLSDGERLSMQRPTVKDRTHIVFSCDITSRGDGFKVILGRGYKVTSACWVEITSERVSAYTYFSYSDPQMYVVLDPTPHGLEIKDYLTVNIQKNTNEGSFITLETSTGMAKIEASRIGASDGEVFASVENGTLENCKLSWSCDGYGYPIWIFGDSYLGYGYPARWPYYLYRDGISRVLLSGYAGMNTQRGLEDFKLALQAGCPRYAVWCLGMNNGDKSDVPEPNWLSATKEFLDICEQKGIVPILSTIPNTPRVLNEPKNIWVRASGYRYVDFCRAVGSQEFNADIKDKKTYINAKGVSTYNITGYEWHEGMIYPDLVHPANNGAAALYSQVLVDFPEILNNF